MISGHYAHCLVLKDRHRQKIKGGRWTIESFEDVFIYLVSFLSQFWLREARARRRGPGDKASYGAASGGSCPGAPSVVRETTAQRTAITQRKCNAYLAYTPSPANKRAFRR